MWGEIESMYHEFISEYSSPTRKWWFLIIYVLRTKMGYLDGLISQQIALVENLEYQTSSYDCSQRDSRAIFSKESIK